jgi:hypothetical protein
VQVALKPTTGLFLLHWSVPKNVDARSDHRLISMVKVFCWTHSINTIVAGAIGGVNTIIVPPKDYVNIALRV